MSENKAVLDAVMRAIELEKETFDFYTRAAHKTFNPEGKRVFNWLAKTEEAHYLKLTELYNSLYEGGRWVFYGGTTISLEPSEQGTSVTFDTDDHAALAIALEIEQRGVDYYATLLEQTTDPAGRTMLETLRQEEQDHIRVIRERLEHLT